MFTTPAPPSLIAVTALAAATAAIAVDRRRCIHRRRRRCIHRRCRRRRPPAAAYVAVAFSAAVATTAAIAVAIAVAITVAATTTTIAVTAAVVDCYVFLAPPLDFDGAGCRGCRPLPNQRSVRGGGIGHDRRRPWW
jgi:hypothetical protein